MTTDGMRRYSYLGLATATITVGLLLVMTGFGLGATSKDFVGDALYAVMMVWWVSVLVPRRRLATRSVAAWTICAIIETSQLWHAPTLDSVRATLFGRLVLGSGFDARDLVAYAIGVSFAALLEYSVSTRHRNA